jgi:hypothetical protein
VPRRVQAPGNAGADRPQDRVAQPLVRRSGLSAASARRPPHRIRLAFFHRHDGEQHLASLPPALDAELIPLHPATRPTQVVQYFAASPTASRLRWAIGGRDKAKLEAVRNRCRSRSPNSRHAHCRRSGYQRGRDFGWPVSHCAQHRRPLCSLIGAVVLRATMDISARAFLLAVRP